KSRAVAPTSIFLQQPLDIVELDLRSRGIGEAAAQLFEDAAHLLHVHLSRDLAGEIVVFVRTKGPAKRVRRVGAGLLAAHPVARALIAIALLHRFGELLGALAQRLERLALRVDGAVGIALAELAAGIAHGAVGLAQTVLAIIALVGTLLALIA